MICKIWGIRPNKKNIKKGVKSTLKYLKDEEKIYGKERPFIEDAAFDEDVFQVELDLINSEGNLFSVLNYVKNEHKTKNVYVSGYMCDPEMAVEEFYIAKEKNLAALGKTLEDDLGNQAFHIVQSFPDGLDISDEEVHRCGIELCKKLEKYQAVVTSHIHPIIDENGEIHGKCKHNHILLNSHIHPDYIDPRHPEKMKYHDCKETYMLLKQLNDEISIEHGLPVIVNDKLNHGYSWFDQEMNNKGKSWKRRVCLDIETNMQLAPSWEEFKDLMQKSGYEIKEGKHETYTAPEGQKVRGSTLGKEYTREYMESYWQFRKSLQQNVESELQNNMSPLPSINYENIWHLLHNEELDLYIKVPQRNKTTGKEYTLFYPVSSTQNEAVVDSYIGDDNIYSLYRNKEEYLGTVSGNMIKAIILDREYTSYEEQKKWEELENQQADREDINRILQKTKQEMQFTQEGWNSSKTGRPYHIGLYDEDGHKRSFLEQLLILAIVVITNEAPEYMMSERDRLRKEKTDATTALSSQKPSWKVERIAEAIRLSKEENIEDLSQLNELLNETGKTYSKLKAQQRKNNQVKEKLIPIRKALLDVKLLEALPSSEDYKMAKAKLYHYGLSSQDKIEDFEKRWKNNQRLEKELEEKLGQTSKKYTKLKKIEYQVDRANNKDYCYGRENIRSK